MQEVKKESIMSEIEQIPESLYEEVLDFIHFLKTKALKETVATAIASESSLKKDWLRAEEDKAWQNL
ncbi:MAG: DUF2281 domain-containing protein [Candidatus Thermoplasmatota archaeon]|nr:DUF2281 domain-containing protein [archaeon]MBU4190262.1 DUF2281 domain-containing protein [Candidatus Thermoplasmatota archaeon]MBU4255667.1 DUF2281 domain-containing protein [Candidatus Thermoplasmatota archaeon]